ncbi:alpha/beta hydrolase [Pigmentiphaga sp. GD03639]|uniref:alpha/beta hydrolase n=1 Tax=Pigmentiphaga sp. GD03639 TaxID=2975354 RepID=UPI002447C5EC|nr:alpha/beta hydrolase [Pigmentiphaga sp. GD03639]MDH2237238.1 alpha/beta hydrolase [Pigmentiphaga sp. GD03639]
MAPPFPPVVRHTLAAWPLDRGNMARPSETGPIIATLPTPVTAALPMKPDDALLARLDPDIAPRVLRLAEADTTPSHLLEPAQVRAAFLRARQPLRRPPVPLDIEDAGIAVDGAPLALRLYRPHRPRPPALLYLHGGAFTNGDLDSHDATCCLLAMEAGVMVASVDYRVLPEHRFPAAFNDTVGALRWLHERAAALGADPARLAVGGDSSGANLALAAALETRGQVPLRAMWLAYPIIGIDFDTPSYRENANAPLLTRARCRRILRDYLGREPGPGDSRVAPLLAPDFAGLPPAVAVAAELDPLRSDAEILADRLREAGAACELVRAAGMPHGFLRWVADSAASRRIAVRSAQALAALLA